MAYSPSNFSPEDLISEYGVLSAQEALYPENKTYIKKRLMCEKELISRLGGSWEVYCELNGWEVQEMDKMIESVKRK